MMLQARSSYRPARQPSSFTPHGTTQPDTVFVVQHTDECRAHKLTRTKRTTKRRATDTRNVAESRRDSGGKAW